MLDDANQAVAYRTGMDDATIREQNGLLYKDPDNPYALPITLLPEGGIYQRQIIGNQSREPKFLFFMIR